MAMNMTVMDNTALNCIVTYPPTPKIHILCHCLKWGRTELEHIQGTTTTVTNACKNLHLTFSESMKHSPVVCFSTPAS